MQVCDMKGNMNTRRESAVCLQEEESEEHVVSQQNHSLLHGWCEILALTKACGQHLIPSSCPVLAISCEDREGSTPNWAQSELRN